MVELGMNYLLFPNFNHLGNYHALTSFSDFGAISLAFLGHIHTIATCGKAKNHKQQCLLLSLF